MRYWFPILLLCFFSLKVSAQKDARIESIRKAVMAINQQKGFTIRELNNEQFLPVIPDRGCVLRGYYKNGVLIKMETWIGISSGAYTTNYYFRNGQLVFVYDAYDSFMDDQGNIASMPRRNFEGRYYFSGGRIVEKKTSGTRYGGRIPDHGKDARNYVRLLSKKRK